MIGYMDKDKYINKDGNNMYIAKHFIIEELVDPETYRTRGDKAWELLDERMLITLDKLRERYGSITVNSWKWGGDRKWSGLRTPASPWYSTYSQHSHGKAADCIIKNYTAEEVRQDILADPDHDDFKLINSIELDVGWLHFDVRNCNRIKAFKP